MTEVAAGDTAAVLAEVGDLAQAQIAPGAADIDREARFPRENLRALAEIGALGLLVGPEQGGLGGGLTSLAQLCETIGGACASTGMVFLMHSVAAATVAGGGGPRAAELLGRMASGDALGTLAFSERGTGAHFYAPELHAERRDGSVHVSGRKAFVTSGGHADVMLQSEGEGEGLDCFAVQKDDRGVGFEGHWEGLGMRGNSSIAVELDDVALDGDARIGEAGGGVGLVFGVVAPTFLVGLAAVNVGIAQAALSVAVEHAKSRSYPDGSSLVEVATVQHALANMDIDTRAARALLHQAAGLGDAGDEGALVPLMEAKVLCTDAAARVTNGVLRTWSAKAIAGLPVP